MPDPVEFRLAPYQFNLRSLQRIVPRSVLSRLLDEVSVAAFAMAATDDDRSFHPVTAADREHSCYPSSPDPVRSAIATKAHTTHRTNQERERHHYVGQSKELPFLDGPEIPAPNSFCSRHVRLVVTKIAKGIPVVSQYR